jgi:tetratricopeptide (TPR) repeat protein
MPASPPQSVSEQKTPTVFVSYSHKDEVWKGRLLPHLKALEQAGVDMKVWEDRQIDAGAKWYPELQSAMADAAVAVLLISADYLASDFCVKEEVPFLLNRQQKQGMLLLPVLIRQCPWKAHRWLAELQMVPRDGKCVAANFPGDLADDVFSDLAGSIYLHFARLAAHPQTAAAIPSSVQELAQPEIAKIPVKASEPPLSVPKWPVLPLERVDLSHLPETGAALFGRDEELSVLDKVWASLGQAGDAAATRVLVFKAQGGVGKSTLINHWLAEMKRDHFRGATRVFGWSFYSQGVREQGAASADTFIAAALKFFGDEAMARSPVSAWDKGARLAHLIGAKRALLVLDGMEPLQSAHWVDRGKLRDPGLEALLRGLARQSAGLCIITTREPLAELGKKSGIVERDLEQITPQAGRALLRAAHIVGTDAELEELAERFGSHALAISLLAVYLHEQPGRGIGPAQALEQIPGKEPLDRVLAGFEKWLGNSAELEVLRLLDFFDRPADEGCLRALRAKPAIPGLTDLVAGLAEADWPRVLARLDKLHLVHARQGDSGKRFVDTHPLIREHFARQLRAHQPDAWRAAHRRLYEHLCASTPDKPQPTLEDLQPLYQAVAHGCQAGLQQEAWKEVYFARIRKSNEYYSVRKLGAFGSDLGAVACFFETPWSHVSLSLNESTQALALNAAASWLRALGRLTEALEPMRANLKMRVEREEWQHAPSSASNLSELELTLGEVAGAVGDAEQSVTYADRSGDAFLRCVNRVTVGDALHQAGRRAEAEARFREAELMQAESQPEYPLLYSLRGFQYCDLLLTEAECAAWQTFLECGDLSPLSTGDLSPSKANQRTRAYEPQLRGVAGATSRSGAESGDKSPHSKTLRAVEQRAAQTLKWVEGTLGLLTIALDHLTLGRAALYRAILEKSEIGNRKSEIEQAVDGLRRSGNMDELPRGLLTRAWLRSLTGSHTGSESAQSDLDEAWEIAERGPMPLFLADIHLHRARLFGMRNAECGVRNEEPEYPWESPQADLAAARQLIERCGYGRRKEELEDAEKVIGL